MSIAASALQAQKRTLRKAVCAVLGSISQDDISAQSQAITQHVKDLAVFRESKRISCYLNMPNGEVNTALLVDTILDEGKTLFVPRIDKSTSGRMDFLRIYGKDDLASLSPGTWGIKEPGDEWNGHSRQNALDDHCDDLEVILLPGVAFDDSLSRLGHGKGYYDRFITSYIAAGRKRPVLVALALREQILEKDKVPVGEHDWRMDYIVGPDRVTAHEA